MTVMERIMDTSPIEKHLILLQQVDACLMNIARGSPKAAMAEGLKAAILKDITLFYSVQPTSWVITQYA